MAYRDKTRAEIIAMQREYRQKNRAHVRTLALKRYRSPNGLVKSMYFGMRQNSKARGHDLPGFKNQDELAVWLSAQGVFSGLYPAYVASGYRSDLRPSIDRINDQKGYELNNIRAVTWAENNASNWNSPAHRARARQQALRLKQQRSNQV